MELQRRYYDIIPYSLNDDSGWFISKRIAKIL